MNGTNTIELTDAQFEDQVLKAEGIIIVDFWAPWCGPCVTMAPALESFAEANKDEVKVYKLNVDDNPKTAEKHSIRSIPTVIFFKDGEAVDVTVAAMSRQSLQQKLENIVNG